MTIAEHYNNMVNAGGSLVVNTAPGRIVQYSDIASLTMPTDSVIRLYNTSSDATTASNVTTVSGNDMMSRDEIEQRFAQLMQGYNQSQPSNAPYNPMNGNGYFQGTIEAHKLEATSKKEENHQTISNKRKLDL